MDAGAAGIRVSGNLNIAALTILNAFNIQVQGTVTGLQTFTGPSIGALTAASNVAGSMQVAVPAPTHNKGDQPSIIIVEVIGYGGGDSSDTDSEQKPPPRKDDHQGYNLTSPVQIVGSGSLNSLGDRYLTDDEKNGLSR